MAGHVDASVRNDGEALRERARLLAPTSGTAAPPVPPGTVARDALPDHLPSQARCVAVAAPAGYGKSTVLAAWANVDLRPCAWLTLSRADGDPTTLLARILLALDGLEPIADQAFRDVLLGDVDLGRARIPRFSVLLERRTRPFLLVLDDVHQLDTTAARAAVRALVDHVPDDSCVAIGTRDTSMLGLSRARAGGRVLDVGVAQLAMSVAEGSALLRGAGVDLSPGEATTLVERSEGWPAGLYLWALARRDAPRDAASLEAPAEGVAEYLRDEILATASPRVADFMLRSSILDRMSGPLCDAVLERKGSAAIIDELVRSNRFVVPLDHLGEWHRYHHLFQDLLRSELRRRDAGVEAMHGRASAWFEADGDVDEAVHHAHAAGDRKRAVALIWSHTNRYAGSGRTATVNRWLARFAPEDVAGDAALALSAAWCSFTGGDMDAVEVWTTFAERAGGEEVLPDGTPRRAAIELLRALVGRDGLSAVRSSAAVADELDRPDSVFRSVACVLEGAAARLLGDPEHARECLERAAQLGALFTPSAQAQALSFLALLDADAGQWGAAESLCDRALALVAEYGLDERPAMAELHATAALLAARAGSTERARELAKQAAWLLTMLKSVAPWLATEARVLLARVSLLLGDAAEAKAWLTEAEATLDRYPDSGVLPERVRAVRSQIDSTTVPLGLSAAPLTAAELRVLRYLPTHLSFAQIADELFVSRNTVKTQAIAVYRKLEVSSRAQAVARGRDLGLVEV